MKEMRNVLTTLIVVLALMFLVSCGGDKTRVEIESAILNEELELVVNYSDGTTESLIGLGLDKDVENVQVNKSGEIEVLYKDESLINLGNKPESFWVVFKDYNGYYISIQKVLKGFQAKEPEEPMRNEYDFVGWDSSFKIILKDTIINAIYSELFYYEVAFKDYNGITLDVQTILEGEDAIAPKEPTRQGYEFIGWDKSYENISSNLEIIAEYKELEFSITFNTNGGNNMESIDGITYGTTVDVGIPYKEDYTFVNWYLDYGLTNKYYDGMRIYKDITLYAKWELTHPIEKITIMVPNTEEYDPFSYGYLGEDRDLKRELQRQVEKEYYVEIIYKKYPDNAPWGPARVEEIIRSGIKNMHMADIYVVNSSWVSEISSHNVLASITEDMIETEGKNIDPLYFNISKIRDKIYGFQSGKEMVQKGLFYNTELLQNYNLEDPVDIYNRGEWTWDKFREYTVTTQKKMLENHSVLGGMPSIYIENMLPLNDTYIVSSTKHDIGMANERSMEVYDYIYDLSENGKVFESNPTYDAGSYQWQMGEVLFHPGEMWFVNAPNRWGNNKFIVEGNIGVVPFPQPNKNREEDYLSPLNNLIINIMAKNINTPEKEELVFKVWNKIQPWKTIEQEKREYKKELSSIIKNEKYVTPFVDIYGNVYYDLVDDLLISKYSPNSWNQQINKGIREGTYRELITSIVPNYEEALDKYLGNREQ